MLLPFSQSNQAVNGSLVFAGDVGATKTNLALYRIENNNYHLLQEAKLVSKDYDNITELIREFTAHAPQPDAVCFGVAGPVLNGHATLSNLQWEIDVKEITAQYPAAKVHLINDLKATAYGLAVLGEEDVKTIHKGSAMPLGNAAVIAPGTGLGEAGLYWDGSYFHPFATEGGHADFAARNSFDFELYTFLQQQFGHVSWERLVCGPGIVNIYHFLRDVKKIEEPVWLTQKMRNADMPAVISEHAEQSLLCKTTMQHFVRYLAYESANLVLKLNATGGLFIGGGIAPQIVHLLENDGFYTSFRQSGRLNFLLEKVPVKIILNTKTALLGAAYYAATQ
ncbi:glucokinase [Agriterribacter sp.]|uniref:glucokinase n=1 Tax=Agriterribacter sp. TaxID=2821509 RepID=UPI002BFF0797|nr:glucokinase [Agriterribacter sp.]HRO47379.1 glucokinase [Agriterribacter sp.]HRQ18798.1 glucokinase [Agriterribacter sp.]